jgi:hypothetical protein
MLPVNGTGEAVAGTSYASADIAHHRPGNIPTSRYTYTFRQARVNTLISDLAVHHAPPSDKNAVASR